VYVSSATTLGGSGQAGPYGLAKESMERLALDHAAGGLPLVVVNPSLCLGEYDRKPSSGRLVLEIGRGRMPLYVEGPVNVVYTGDVGRGIAAALAAGRVGERYVLAGEDTTFGWLLRQIAYEAGARPPRFRAPLALMKAGARLVDAAARARGKSTFASVGVELLAAARRRDGAVAARELGLPEPTPAVETVRRAVRWFRESGMLNPEGRPTGPQWPASDPASAEALRTRREG
jgi:dihydroflavonol-4-reductase